jgi:hypothetical protein
LVPAAACSSSTAWICGSRTGGATALHPIWPILGSDGRADGHDRERLRCARAGRLEAARKLFAAAGENAEALEGLGLAAWWLDEEAALDARERAYRLYRERGDARPGAPGPFALSAEGALEELAASAGLAVTERAEAVTVWEYADDETALRGLLAPGPAVRAIETAGEEAVRAGILEALAPFLTREGGYRLENTFVYVVAGG